MKICSSTTTGGALAVSAVLSTAIAKAVPRRYNQPKAPAAKNATHIAVLPREIGMYDSTTTTCRLRSLNRR